MSSGGCAAERRGDKPMPCLGPAVLDPTRWGARWNRIQDVPGISLEAGGQSQADAVGVVGDARAVDGLGVDEAILEAEGNA